MTALPVEFVDEPEATTVADLLLPLAVPDYGPLLTGEENYGELLAGLSSCLEAFQQVFLNVVSSNPNGPNNSQDRTLFVTAMIPGLTEKIPVYGMKETRVKEKGKIYVKLEIFVFNGQERLRAGFAHVILGSDNLPRSLNLFSVNGNHSVMTVTTNRGATQAYDNKGRSIHGFGKRTVRSRKKNRLFYEARETNVSRRKIADIDVDYDKVGYSKKRLKEMSISFGDVSDYVAKPQVLLSAIMLLYQNKLQ